MKVKIIAEAGVNHNGSTSKALKLVDIASKASLTPYELKDMIERIRETEMTLGKSKKFITKNESYNKDIIRRSLYASKFIKKGEKFSEKNLICLRPDKGISAIYWKNMIGKKAIKNFKKNEKIKKK